MITKVRATLLAITMLAVAGLFTACGNDGRPSLEDRIGEGNHTYTGVIQPLEQLDIYQQGTHQLNMGEKSLLIQSSVHNLGRYMGEEVVISGVEAARIGNSKPVLNVTEIAYADESRNQETVLHEDKSAGYRFKYLATWEKADGKDLTLTAMVGEEEVVMASATVFSDQTNLDDVVASEEDGDGTAVTIGAQRALRFSDEMSFRVYIPNPPQKKVYRITFPTFPFEEENKREVFYRLLESFELIYSSTVSGEKCGGLQQVACAEGYRCELSSGGKYAEGICVSLEAGNGSLNCPFIAPPSSCKEYRISEYGKAGCPARYECVGSSEPIRVDTAPLPPADDMVMSDGQEDDEVTDDESDEERTYDTSAVGEVSRVYNNIRQEFTMLYPSNWYYASFGAVNGSFLTVGFADVALESPEEAVITVRVMDVVPKRAPEGRFQLSTRRDLNSFFVLEGPPEFEGVLKAMLESIKDERA